MEKTKNDEKTKHGEQRDYYSQGWAFAIIALMFFLLTLMTSDQTLNVLPIPQIFFYGSIIIGMTLSCFYIILGSAWRNLPFRLRDILIIAVLVLCASFLIYRTLLIIGTVASWVFAFVPYFIFDQLPVVIFPLLMIATFIVAILYYRMRVILPRSTMKKITYLIILFSAVYIWGYAAKFGGKRYDEGLKIDSTSYHAIVYGAWDGDSDLVFLYECLVGFVACEMIYQSGLGNYSTYETQLVYDEEAGLLRLEHEESLLYEHPIRQE